MNPNDYIDYLLKKKKRKDKTDLILDICWGSCFGLVMASVITGSIRPWLCGLQLVVWTINGMIKGIGYQKNRRLNELWKEIINNTENNEEREIK